VIEETDKSCVHARLAGLLPGPSAARAQEDASTSSTQVKTAVNALAARFWIEPRPVCDITREHRRPFPPSDRDDTRIDYTAPR